MCRMLRCLKGTKRQGWFLASALLSAIVVLGCGSAGGASTDGPTSGDPKQTLIEQDCIDQWNSSDNASLRRQTAPPDGPAKALGVELSGDYVVYVGITQPIGSAAGQPPPTSCYIYFRFPKGDGNEAALISIPAPTPPGSYVLPGASVSYGINTDVTGSTTATQTVDGMLSISP
jgi:hypothetical protein